ncbi:MAG TPA: glycosyl transferase family 90 [Chlamydiales bacterium]|nr:glycosyl transferase family 90 [Chlamydiales bacterium]
MLIRILTCVCFSITVVFADWQTNLKNKIKRNDFPSWMIEQIREELSFCAHSVSEQDLYRVLERFPELGFLLCNIENNQLSWTYYPNDSAVIDSRADMFIAGIKTLLKVTPLPNMKFLVHTGEAFCEKTTIPILTWCKHNEWSRNALSIPDYEAISGNTNYLFEVVKGSHLYPWNAKKKIGFWRGGTTGGFGYEFMPRVKVILESLKYPNLLDARFTGIYPGQEGLYPQTFFGSSLSVSNHLKYKYQILIDGHVSAFSRFYWQLFSGCLTFKHDSCWYQWFYRELKPYVHYVPYHADASNLIEQINWAISHDQEAYVIAQNALHFATQNLTHENVMLYLYLALIEYARLMR